MSKRADETRTVEDARRAGYALLVSGASSVESIRLPPGESFVLGRAPGCDIVVNDDSVSREHARLRFGARITLEDLGSKNGTHVQGRRLAPHAEEAVGVGAVFELGSVTVVVQRPQGIAPARATPAAPGK